MTEKRVGGNHLAGEKPDGGCQRLAGESGMNGDDRLAGESGRSRHRVLGQRPWHPGIVAGVIDPSELPRAASEVGNRIRHASDEIMQLADEKGKTDEAIIEWKPIAEQTIRAVTPSSEAREANDLRRSEIQSTSYLVVDNVRSTMTGGQSALAGLDSFAMLECYAPASLIIDEWGIDRDSLEPAPPLSSVSGKPLNIVGVWKNAEFALGEGHGIFRCNVTVGEMAISTVQMLFGIAFLAATQAVMHCAAGRAHLTDVEGNVIVFGRGRSQRATLRDDIFRKGVHALNSSKHDDGLPLLRQVLTQAQRFEPSGPNPAEVKQRQRKLVQEHMNDIYTEVRTRAPDMPWTNDMLHCEPLSLAAVECAPSAIQPLLSEWNQAHHALLRLVECHPTTTADENHLDGTRSQDFFGGGEPSAVPKEAYTPLPHEPEAVGAMSRDDSVNEPPVRQPTILRRQPSSDDQASPRSPRQIAAEADEAWAEKIVRQDRPEVPYKRTCPIWKALLAYVRVEATKRPLHKTFSRPHGTSDPSVTKSEEAQGKPYSKHGFMLFCRESLKAHYPYRPYLEAEYGQTLPWARLVTRIERREPGWRQHRQKFSDTFDASDLGVWDQDRASADADGRRVRFEEKGGRTLAPMTPDEDLVPPPTDLDDVGGRLEKADPSLVDHTKLEAALMTEAKWEKTDSEARALSVLGLISCEANVFETQQYSIGGYDHVPAAELLEQHRTEVDSSKTLVLRCPVRLPGFAVEIVGPDAREDDSEIAAIIHCESPQLVQAGLQKPRPRKMRDSSITATWKGIADGSNPTHKYLRATGTDSASVGVGAAVETSDTAKTEHKSPRRKRQKVRLHEVTHGFGNDVEDAGLNEEQVKEVVQDYAKDYVQSLPRLEQELLETVGEPVDQSLHDEICQKATELGVDKVNYVCEWDDWDRKHAVQLHLKEGKVLPPPEYRRYHVNLLDAIARAMNPMLHAGFYDRSIVGWSSPLHAVPKKVLPGEPQPMENGKPVMVVRITGDFRKANECSADCSFPVATVDDSLSVLQEMSIESFRQYRANKSGQRRPGIKGLKADFESPACNDHATPPPWPATGTTGAGKGDGPVCGSCDLARAFHRLMLMPGENGQASLTQNLASLNCRGLGTFKALTASMGLKQIPALFARWVEMRLQNTGCLYAPGTFAEVSAEDEAELREFIGDGLPIPQGFARIYVDDILIVSCNKEEHRRAWLAMLFFAKRFRFFLSKGKSKSFARTLNFLGFVVGPGVLCADPQRCRGIALIPRPKTAKDVRRFMGSAGYYRCFVESFARLSASIHRCVKADVPDDDISSAWTMPLPLDHAKEKTHWTTPKGVLVPKDAALPISAESGFQSLKARLCSLVCLTVPDFSRDFHILVDASTHGFGCVLTQRDPETRKFKPIDFHSKAYTLTQMRWASVVRECYGLVRALDRYRATIYGSGVTAWIISDCRPLTGSTLLTQKVNSSMIQRWQAEISEYSSLIRILYRNGESPVMSTPDLLSRSISKLNEDFEGVRNEFQGPTSYMDSQLYKGAIAQGILKAEVHDTLAAIVVSEPETDPDALLQNEWARSEAAEILNIRKPTSDVYVGDGQRYIGNIHESLGLRATEDRMNHQILQAAARHPQHSHRLGVSCTRCGVAPAVKGTYPEELLLGHAGMLDHIMAVQADKKLKEAGGARDGPIFVTAENDTLARIAKTCDTDAKLLLKLNRDDHPGLRGVNNRFKSGVRLFLTEEAAREAKAPVPMTLGIGVDAPSSLPPQLMGHVDAAVDPALYADSEFAEEYAALKWMRRPKAERDRDIAKGKGHVQPSKYALSPDGRILMFWSVQSARWLVCVPGAEKKLELIRDCHLRHGHPSAHTQFRILSSFFFWKGMSAQIKDYISRCSHCSQTIHSTLKPPGLMERYAPVEDICVAYHIDFLTGLAPSECMNSWTAVLTCVDRCSKRLFATPCRESISGAESATLLYEEVILRHSRGAPISISSDRDSRFMGSFFQQFYSLMGVRLTATSGQRSTANGAIEIQHRLLNRCLRGGNTLDQSSWPERLSTALNHINSWPKEQLGNRSPICVETGREPLCSAAISNALLQVKKVDDAVRDRIERMNFIRADVIDILEKFENEMKRQKDRRCRDWPQKGDLKPGKWVYLKFAALSLPITSSLPSRKQWPVYVPAKLVRSIRGSTWSVDFGVPVTRMHTTYHVSNMRPFARDGEFTSQLTADGRIMKPKEAERLLEQMRAKDGHYEIETILRHRVRGRRTSYLVAWKHWPLSSSSWIDSKDVRAPKLEKLYWEKYELKRAYLDGRIDSFPTRHNHQALAGSAHMPSKKGTGKAEAIAGIGVLEDVLGPARTHDESVLSRADNPTSALDLWLVGLEQTLMVGSIAETPASSPRGRLHQQLRTQGRRRAKSGRQQGPMSAPPADIEANLDCAAWYKALTAHQQRVSRQGGVWPSEPSPADYNTARQSVYKEARGAFGRTKHDPRARAAVEDRIYREAKRVAKAGRTEGRRLATRRQRIPPHPRPNPAKVSRSRRRPKKPGERNRGR